MDHDRKPVPRKQLVDRRAIGQIQPLEAETRTILENIEPGLLQRRVIITVTRPTARRRASSNRFATWNPMKPAAPVTKIA